MPLPLRAPAKPLNVNSKGKIDDVKSANFTDTYGIVYIGNVAKVNVNVSVKLSRQYQSAGLDSGMEFTTNADGAEAAIKNASKKIRDVLAEELAHISQILTDVGA